MRHAVRGSVIGFLNGLLTKVSRTVIRDYGEIENLKQSPVGAERFFSKTYSRLRRQLLMDLYAAYPYHMYCVDGVWIDDATMARDYVPKENQRPFKKEGSYGGSYGNRERPPLSTGKSASWIQALEMAKERNVEKLSLSVVDPGRESRYKAEPIVPEYQSIWVIEVMDGKENFLMGLPQFCISIALIEDGETTSGVIYDPLRHELFWAQKGRGAFLNNTRLRIGSCRPLNQGTLALAPFRRVQWHELSMAIPEMPETQGKEENWVKNGESHENSKEDHGSRDLEGRSGDEAGEYHTEQGGFGKIHQEDPRTGDSIAGDGVGEAEIAPPALTLDEIQQEKFKEAAMAASKGAPIRRGFRVDGPTSVESVPALTLWKKYPIYVDKALEARFMRLSGCVSLDLAYVAAGRYDGFLGQGISVCQRAAGQLLIREAGGFVKTASLMPRPSHHALSVRTTPGQLLWETCQLVCGQEQVVSTLIQQDFYNSSAQ